jgi:hypothetical protein
MVLSDIATCEHVEVIRGPSYWLSVRTVRLGDCMDITCDTEGLPR